MLKILIHFILLELLLAEQKSPSTIPTTTNITNVKYFSTVVQGPRIHSAKNSTYFYIIGNNSRQENDKIYQVDAEKSVFKRKDSVISKKGSNSPPNNQQEQLKLVDTPFKNVYIDFELVISDFVSFEPKTGMAEFDAKLKFKWWHASKGAIMNSGEIDDDSLNTKNLKFSPTLKFADDPSVALTVKNQMYSFNNVETYFERKKETQQSLLAKFEKFKANNNQAVAAALLGHTNDVYMSTSYKNVSLNKKIIMTRVSKHYSCLEQNVTLKFKCHTDEDNDDSSLDTSHFPFDSHACELNFEIDAALLANSESPRAFTPSFVFASLVPDQPNRIEIDNSMFDFYSYNKLVKSVSNYSWISREWLLKKITVFYANLTHSGPSSSFLASTNSSLVVDPDEKLDQYLISRKDFTNATAASFASDEYFRINTALPPLSVKFYIFRRREPQVYVFVLPLVLFTLVTFLIFFLPTSNTSEKTLIAFLNFACLLGFNLYLFKLVIYTYDFMRIPLLLQYSNCLMVIQLGVLAYTCLVKSVYHYGFLTFNAGSFTSLAEDAFRQMFFINHDQAQQLQQQQMQQNQAAAHHHQHLMALAAAGQVNPALDLLYSSVEPHVKCQNMCNNNSRCSLNSNHMFLNKSVDKIKEETGMVIYHGKWCRKTFALSVYNCEINWAFFCCI